MRDRIFVHVVWTTRDRTRAINKSIADFLAGFLAVICRQERARLLEVGVVASHIHLLIRLHPTTAIPRLMQRMKGGSSVIINRSRWSRQELKWSKGYNIHSVDLRSLDATTEYVRNQDKRHPAEAIKGWGYGRKFTDGCGSSSIHHAKPVYRPQPSRGLSRVRENDNEATPTIASRFRA